MRNLKLTLQYDGTNYVGWQRQAAGTSIQGLLEDAFEPIAGTHMTVHGAGRTDAGVHALAQVASASFPGAHESSVLARALNAVLPTDVRVLSVEDMPADFHARFSAVGKTYEYRIVNAPMVSPFLVRYVWHVPNQLDINAMHPQITSLQRDAPGYEAGLRTGDIVMAAAGQRDVNRNSLVDLIKAHEGKPITLEIKRDGQTLQVPVTPRKIGDTVIIGAQLNGFELRTIEPGPIEAFKMSLDQNWTWAKMIVQTLGGLFTRHTSVKQLMGPVAIADLSGMAAEQGLIQLFSLMAMISLNLGLLNLMGNTPRIRDFPVVAIFEIGMRARRRTSRSVRISSLIGRAPSQIPTQTSPH